MLESPKEEIKTDNTYKKAVNYCQHYFMILRKTVIRERYNSKYEYS